MEARNWVSEVTKLVHSNIPSVCQDWATAESNLEAGKSRQVLPESAVVCGTERFVLDNGWPCLLNFKEQDVDDAATIT